MEIKGKITKCVDLSGKNKEGKDYQKFQYVIEEQDTEHPNSVVVTTFGEKVPKINVGGTGVASINLKVSEFNGKVYNNLDMWKWKGDEAF